MERDVIRVNRKAEYYRGKCLAREVRGLRVTVII